MERILNIYECSTLKSFFKQELLGWFIVFSVTVILLVSCAYIFKSNIWLYLFFLVLLIAFLIGMHKYKYKVLSQKFPLDDNALKIVHYSLLEKRVYWTQSRFSKFYSELIKTFNDKAELFTLIKMTKAYFKEILDIFDRHEKIIETPRRQLYFWLLGVLVTFLSWVTYKIIEKQPPGELILILIIGLVISYMVYIVYSVFFDKYYTRKYKIIELYNFLVCAEAIMNSKSAA